MTGAVTRNFGYEAEAFRSYCQRQFETPLDYSFDAVAIVDGILGEAYGSLKGMNEAEAWTYLNNMTLAAGAFLGEVLVRNGVGTWWCSGDPKHLQDWGVKCAPNARGPANVPVFQAVYNFLQKGPSETLLALVAPLLKADGHWPQQPMPNPAPRPPSHRAAAKKAAKSRAR
jgi:hypothetical protein